MAYELSQFIADCRAILQRDPGPQGREDVRAHLERLLANNDFVQATCGADAPLGLRMLYEDKDLGFQILAHVNDKARKSPPHDHGASWAIYGQATGYTDMIEWERVDGGAERAELRETSNPAMPASIRTAISIRSTIPTARASSASPAPISTRSIVCAST
jgi:predicted metal-dependent enzyme (double-stranded beta helix superfamily)